MAADKNYCMSSYLAFRYIVREDADFAPGLHHEHFVQMPDEKKIAVCSAEEIDRALQAQFDALVLKGQVKTIVIILAVMLVMLAYCLFISRKYVAPILRKIDQLRSSEDDGEQLRITEIDDLFTYFEERSSIYEEQLKKLQSAKDAAEEEVLRTRREYESALEKYELAQSEIVHLSEESKSEIVLEEYEYFICNLKTLTPKEYRIYELYVEGKTTAEIASIIGIKENTMKYHNKNIYGKLGISSRKQLLRFAALKQH
jgi:DNA-binding CsgD family transcriptional regulator